MLEARWRRHDGRKGGGHGLPGREGLGAKDGGEGDALEGKLSEVGGRGRGLEESNLVVAAERLEEGGIAVIVATSEDEAATLDILLHDLEELADLVVCLLFSLADVSEGEKGLGAAEAAAKLAKGGGIGRRKRARGNEGAGQAIEAKDDVDENGLDV